jgi:hypothetical protein
MLTVNAAFIVSLSLVLWLAAIPMAARRASMSIYWTHAVLSVLVAVAQALETKRIYSAFSYPLPLGRIGAVWVAEVTIPTIAAGWLARVVVRRWPRRPWVASGLVVSTMLLVLLAAVFTGHAEAFMPFDMINAVQ